MARLSRRGFLIGGSALVGAAGLGGLGIHAVSHPGRVQPGPPGGRGAPAALDDRRDVWDRLIDVPPPTASFDPATLASQPEPLRRYLTHVIAPGTALHDGAMLTLEGEIKLKTWSPFTSTLLLVPPAGRIWVARAVMNGLPVPGLDLMADGQGEMRWKLLGLFPVVQQRDDDVSRSAVTVPGLELGLCPTAYRHFQWTQTGADQVTGTWESRFGTQRTILDVDASGRLVQVSGPRWGTPDPDGVFRSGTFLGRCEGERDFDGIRVMEQMTAGWVDGVGRFTNEFFHARVTSVTWL